MRRTLASLLFAIATIAVSYLVTLFLPSVPIIPVVAGTVIVLLVAGYLWISGRKEEPEGVRTTPPLPQEVVVKYPEPQKANLDIQVLQHYKGYMLPPKVEILPDLPDGQHQATMTNVGASTPPEEYGRLQMSQKLEVYEGQIGQPIKELIAKFAVVRVYCLAGDVENCKAEIKHRFTEMYGKPMSGPMAYDGYLNWFDLNSKRDIQTHLEGIVQEKPQGINKYLHNSTETLHEGDEKDLLVFYMIRDFPVVFICSDVLGQGSSLGTVVAGQRLKFELEIALTGMGYAKTIWHFTATVNGWDDFVLQRM